MNLLKKNYIFSDIDSLKGVGKKIKTYLKKRKSKKLMIYCGIYLIQALIVQI